MAVTSPTCLTRMVDSSSKEAATYSQRLAILTQNHGQRPPIGPWVEIAGFDALCVNVRKYAGNLTQGFSPTGSESWTRMMVGEPRDPAVKVQIDSYKGIPWNRQLRNASCSGGDGNELPNNFPTTTVQELNLMHANYVKAV